MKETSFEVLGNASRNSEVIQHCLHIVRGYGSATIGLWKSRTEESPACQNGWVYAEFCARTKSEYQRDIRACAAGDLIGFTFMEIAKMNRVRILNSRWYGDLCLTADGKFVRPTSLQINPSI